MIRFFPLAAAPLLALLVSTQDVGAPVDPEARAQATLEQALKSAGAVVDWEAGALAIPAEVLVREDLLEYLLVAPHGQAHESLFLTEVGASLINAGLLGLGATPGRNARVVGEGDERSIELPTGDGFYLYAAWREGDETYLFRVEDLIANLENGRSLERHRWVFLGSRFVERDGESHFAADQWGNLVNLSFFYEGDTLLTAAVRAAESQTAWLPNAWLVPPSGSPVLFVFAREPLVELPPALAASVPELERETPK
ncbi:MAG: YdjY domain-containing protein [Planctomycetota bacterium]